MIEHFRCRICGKACECEDCMQTYPERFYVDPETGEWENFNRIEDN